MKIILLFQLSFLLLGTEKALGQTNPCSSNPCQNGAACQEAPISPGYVCFCVGEWIGQDCEMPKEQLLSGARRNCDQNFHLETNGSITSPEWPDPYGINQVCYYQVKFPNAESIRLNIDFFITELDKDELYFNDGPTPPGIRDPEVFKLSGDLQPGNRSVSPLLFDTNQLTLIWESDRNLAGPGFLLSFIIDVDFCWQNQCQGSSVCLDMQDGYTCLCPDTHVGEFCEFGLVLIAVTQPIIRTGALVEGTFVFTLNFDLSLTPSENAIFQAVGFNLWQVTAFFSGTADGNGQRIGTLNPLLTQAQGGASWLPSANTNLFGIQANFILPGFVCSDVQYLCAIIDKSSTADFEVRGDPTEASLIGCTPISCRGVEISSTAIFGLDNVNIQGGMRETFNFDLALSSVAGAGSVQGTNLWRVVAFASSFSDGSVRVAETVVGLQTSAASAGITAGVMTSLSNVEVDLDLRSFGCEQLRYLCVEVQRDLSSSPPFTLTGVPDENVLITCQQLMCGAVLIHQVSFTSMPGMILANSPNNMISFELTAFTLPTSATIAGVSLWMVDVFTSTNIDGNGIPAVNQTIVLPPTVANTPISTVGSSLVLSNLATNLDLTGLSCSDVRFICLTLRRNILSQPVYILEGVPNDSILTRCQFFSCTVLLTCNDLTCNNGGSCEQRQDGPVCQCAVGWTGTTCNDAINACEGITCLFGGTCLDNQFSFTCQCTLGRQGMLCGEETIGVIVQSVTPIPQNAILREGVVINALNLIASIQTDASGDNISGTGLWDVQFYLNDQSDGSGVRIDLDTSPLNSVQANTPITAGSTASISQIFSSADLSTLTCQDVPYICVELSKGENPSPDFLLTGSLIGCSMINCEGVEIINSMLQFSNQPPTLVERSSTNRLFFTFAFSSSTSGGSVSGDDLWNLVWYLSTDPDDPGSSQTFPINLTPPQSGFDLAAGMTGLFQSVSAQINTLPFTCGEFDYICARLERNPAASVDFTLSSSSEMALSDCVEVACRGVQVTNLVPTYRVPEQLQSGQSNFINFNLLISSGVFGASVNGTDLWQVDVFTNTDSNGLGITAAETVASIPTDSLQRSLVAGSNLILEGITGSLDLTSVTCSEVPFVCVRFSRNQFSNPVFTLENVNGEGDIVQCMEYDCEDPDPCETSTCLNGGQCSFTDRVVCSCMDSFFGDICQHDNPCFPNNPCQFGGSCTPFEIPGGVSFFCNCIDGYSGSTCDIPPDPCLSSPCENGTCIRLGTSNQFQCLCDRFFEGNLCQFQDPCGNSPCDNGGTCLGNIGTGSFQCVCPDEYKGSTCQFPEPCSSSPCLNNGVCTSDVIGSQYMCSCQQGFIGSNCQTRDPCFSSPCLNGGSCFSADNQGLSFFCLCNPNFQGDQCQFMDPCSSSPCSNGGICLPDIQNNQFSCFCVDNFMGDLCQSRDPCFSSPCANGGTCNPDIQNNQFSCSCGNSFVGALCQFPDPCISNPCINGGGCSSSSSDGSFSCNCPNEFFGDICQLSRICASLPCRNGGTCNPTQAGTSFSCTCTSEFLLPDCASRDPCFANPCQNGGTCALDSNPRRYSCTCPSDYLGENCQNLDPCLDNPCLQGGTCNALSQGLFFQCQCPSGSFGNNCQNTDPCSSNPCDNGGTCHATGDFTGFNCICPAGIIGPTCQVQAPCTVNPCSAGSTCVNDISQPSGFICLCQSGRVGDTCNGIDVCDILSPCLNAGSCIPNTEEGTFSCRCSGGFTGEICQIGNPCTSLPCLNGGTCVPTLESYICLCAGSFNGANCGDNSTTPTEPPMTCQEDTEFLCLTTECISLSQRCDGFIDCVDGFFDENGCLPPCNADQFSCEDGGACIPLSQLCDNTPNCNDGSDETPEQCLAPCSSDPCRNGGSCNEPTPLTFDCTCLDGYTGVFCESTISPSNDPPEFTSPNTFSIPEDTSSDSLVITLMARDLNGDSLEFGIPDSLGLFYMTNLSSGQIFLRQELDRETLGDSLNLTVMVRDSEGARTDQVITIIIEDVNDNPPADLNLPSLIQLPEDTPQEEIYQVNSTDLDDGLNALVSYTIESVTLEPSSNASNTANLFAVNPVTGDVFLTHNLDFETTQQYFITIVAQDQGSPPMSVSGVLTVDVLDIQDSPPIYINTPYDITIPETQNVDTVIQTVLAVDQDTINPRAVSYSIVAGNEDGLFTLDAMTGQLVLAQPLDRDDQTLPSSFTVTVRAEETGFPSYFVLNTFSITVMDVQDESPSFNQTAYETTILETETVGNILPLNIFVTDGDRTTEDTITLDLDGPDNLPFSVSPTSINNQGSVLISVSGPLDYETNQTYQFMLIATEIHPGTGETFSSTSLVTVNIQDVNDNRPLFTQDPFMGNVTEGAMLGTFITTVSATDEDADLNAEIIFTIVGGNEEGLFRIDPMTGEITTQSPSIDYETSQRRYILLVEATNPTPLFMPPPDANIVQVIIDILDVNDNSPVFDSSSYNTSVTEIAEPGIVVIRVGASDIDSGLGGEITYTINGGNAEGHFEIDGMTGDIRLRTAVDREIRDFYSLTVVATDQDEPFNIGLTTVDISVRDYNDNDPVWTQTTYITDLSEDAEIDSFVTMVLAEDDDIGQNALLTYTLSPNNPLFVIDTETGEIFLNGSLDRESEDEITLTVLVTDNGNPRRPATIPAMVIIRVTDINDNRPMFINDPFDFTVRENLPENSPVGQVLFTDVDLEGMHMFSLSSGEGQFQINPFTGEIFTSVILDREEQSFYQLMVTISDGVSVAMAPVNITIIDINDNNPVFGLDEYSAVISEDFPLFTMILTINASDADQSAGDITFRFESNRNVEGPFTLDLTTGLLEISTPLDRELESAYTLRVVAMDSLMGGVQRNSTVTINIDVTDVNDNGPQFTQNPYPGQSVPEDIEAGVPIIQVSTTDEDTDENAGVVYQIIQGNVGDVFEIDGEGIISRGSVPLDRETLDFYLLVVEASDPSNSELPRDTAVVTIEVTDVNDVIPEFSQPFYSRLDLVEDASIETVVVDVQAQDMDLGPAGEIVYAIIEGNQMGLFRIDPLTGIISIVSELPSISDTLTFNLTVQAQDQDSPFNAGIAFVIVNVIDAGEIPPEFVLSRYEVDSIENLQTGTFVVQVLALVENRPADVSYILDPNSHPDVMMHFQVNDTTGEITVRFPLDRETNDFFAFTVIAAGETVSSSTAVWVTVLDANDNIPIFLEFPEDVRIPEDSPTQTVIGEIRTTDLDINQNAQINYVISDGNREGAFTFRRNSDGTASIITTRPLNREFTDEYNITVTAFDGGVPRLESSQTIRIVLTDANDNAPLFTVSSYSFEIIENQLSSLPVATLTVTDNDLPSTNNLVFTIVQGNEEDKFEINNQGDIFLTSPLDRETLDSFQLTVLLEDPTFDPQYQGFVSVFVTVLDENDNAPAFDEPSFQAQVEEGVRSAIVTTVEASDRDLGVNREIRFNVTGPNSDFFSIDPIQGHLITDVELDRETLDEYIVTITATDQAIDSSARLTSTTTVTVAVTDINDSRPTFLFEQYGPYYILEESPNAFIDSIQAVDPDLGGGGRVSYSVTGQLREYFFINSATGLLTVNPNRPLDYETQQQINITIVASDTEGLESTTDITVNVLNVNDNTPRFEGAPYTVTISENVNVGTLAFIAGATDADLGLPGVVTYDIIDGNIDDVFWINPLNGEIYVNQTLDRETTPSYRLTLEARDNPENTEDTRTTTTTLSIEISDADDVPPTFPNDEYFGSILENSFAGTLVQMDRPIRAVDSDEVSVIVYNITGEDSEVFSIDRLTGELRSSVVFDHEVKPSYTFTVIATDSQGSYAQAAVIVTVLDANDNEPLLDLSVYNFTIPENSVGGVVVGQLTASDGDGDMVRFSIVTGGGDRFLIDAETGEITVSPRAILDRERQASYMLTISVSDQGAPQLTSLGTVNIDLSDINDSPPVFVETESIVSVSESEEGTSINFFQAKDPDLNALVIYLIDSVTILDPNGRDISAEIDSSNWFRLNQTSGELILVEQVDREAVSEINVVISARDENGVDPETRTSNPNAEVQILITDINDNAPVIEPISVKTLQEESSIGTIITTVVADDLDQGEGGRITYIIEDSQNVPVMIDPDTGVLTVGSVIDREDISWVNFTVLAIDNGAPSLNSTVDINLRITDINDNNPSFNETLYSFMVNESLAALECFAVVLAQDPDAGDFGAVTYELSGGDGLFFINTETGEICLSGELDRESVSQYSLIITAKDNPAGSANNRRETSTRVVIDVTDTNEFAPRSDLEFPFDLPEGESPGTVVGKITALDPDTPEDPLIYIISNIQPSDGENLFTINQTTGEIILIGEIDSDNSSFSDQYRINIIISDGGIPEQTTNVVSVITILDTNDSPPSFDESLYNVSVSEDFDTTNPVVTVSANDPDEQSVLTYIIVDGNPLFRISSDTGEIRFLQMFDHETQNFYELVVAVRDQDGLESTASVEINVRDISDVEPRFTQTLYIFPVLENQPNGTVVGTVVAADNNIEQPSSSGITYAIITGNDMQNLAIDPLTGVIATTRPLDREILERLVITVEAQGGGLVDTAVVTVLVLDENDNAPTFIQMEFIQNIRVTESAGTSIISPFATDQDSGINALVSYRIIEGNIAGIFGIDETNGRITLTRSVSTLPDPPSEFRLVVEAFDRGSPSQSTNVTIIITVGNDEDRRPVFLVPEQGQILALPENEPPGYLIVCLNATYPDIDTSVDDITYEFLMLGSTSNTQQLFTLNSTTGKLYSNFTADRESESSYTFFVIARSEGGTTPFQITIAITDKDDSEPTFPLQDGKVPDQNILIDENIELLSVIGSITPAVDPDVNSTVFYCIVSGNEDGFFMIDRATGDIITLRELDYENQTTHRIVVKATGNDSCTFNASTSLENDATLKTVVISLNNLDDNPVRFLERFISAGVSLDATVGSTVIIVQTIDPDTGLPGDVVYSIDKTLFIGEGPETVNGVFAIDPDTGRIFTNREFIRDDQRGVFQLQVLAMSATVNTATTVEVHVFDSSQQVILEVLDTVGNVRRDREEYIRMLMRISCGTVFIDEISVFLDNGQPDGTRTMILFHVRDSESGEIFTSETVISKLEENSANRVDLPILSGGVVAVPTGTGTAASRLGFLGLLFLLLGAFILLGALLLICGICCLPICCGRTRAKNGALAGASGSGTDKVVGVTYTAYNETGDWSLQKEFEAQEQTMDFGTDNAYQVDKAYDALLMTSFVGGGHMTDGNGSSQKSGTLRSSMKKGFARDRYNTIGTTHSDGSVSFQTDEVDAAGGGRYPRMQETSFIENSSMVSGGTNSDGSVSFQTDKVDAARVGTYPRMQETSFIENSSMVRGGTNTTGRREGSGRVKKGMSTSYIDREHLRKQAASEVRSMIGSQDRQTQLTSRSAPRLSDLPRSVSVLVGYADETETTHSSSRGKQNARLRGQDNEGYDNWEVTGLSYVSAPQDRTTSDDDRQRMLEEKLQVYEEENVRIQEMRYKEMMREEEEQVQPRREEVVEELFIIDGDEPFPLDNLYIQEGSGYLRDSLEDDDYETSSESTLSINEYFPDSNHGTLNRDSYSSSRSRSYNNDGHHDELEFSMETNHVERKHYKSASNDLGMNGFYEMQSGL